MAAPPVTSQPESIRSLLTTPLESVTPPVTTPVEPMTPPPNYESVMSGKSDLPPAYDSPFVSRLNVAIEPSAPEHIVPSTLVPENDEEDTAFCCEKYYNPMTNDGYTCLFCNLFCHPITAFLRLCGCKDFCVESRSSSNIRTRTYNANESSYNAVDNTWGASGTEGGLGGCFCCSDDDCLVNFCECDDGCGGVASTEENGDQAPSGWDCWGVNEGSGDNGGDMGGVWEGNPGDGDAGGGNDYCTDTGGGDCGGDTGGGDTGGGDCGGGTD